MKQFLGPWTKFAKCFTKNIKSPFKYLPMFISKYLMKKIFPFLVFIFFVCKISSAQLIYSSDDKYNADIVVFVSNNRYNCDLVVFKSKDKYNLGNNKGHWYFSDNKYNSDKIIYFTEDKYNCDLIIYFTEDKYNTGWKKASKKHLLY
tara:strand:+ start:40 stop:480 length:441 start_codon:yes stop_codon:yes gene_type:complete